MPETREQRNLRLRTNAARLKAAGFTSKEADRFKAASEKAIQKAIAERKLPEIDIRAQKAGRASGVVRSWAKQAPVNTYGEIVGKIVYDKAGEEGAYRYKAPYSYVLTYVTKTTTKEGVTWDRKLTTINTEHKLTKKEVIDRAYTLLVKDEEKRVKYKESKIIKSSFKLVQAVENPEYL